MKKNLIFDIGMHTGQDTQYYLDQGFDVVAVEADPVLVERNSIKFRSYVNAQRLTILNVGIGKSNDNAIPFYRNLYNSEWSSFDQNMGTRNNTPFEVVPVNLRTTKSIFEEYGIPFYVKIDIEGYDHFCLSDIPETGDRPPYVSCEACHIEWLGALRSKGYTKFKMINQCYDWTPIVIDQEKSRLFTEFRSIKRTLKQKLENKLGFNFVHPTGSSGPFGENTKGEWKTYHQVKKDFLEYYQNGLNVPLNRFSWFDFHASL